MPDYYTQRCHERTKDLADELCSILAELRGNIAPVRRPEAIVIGLEKAIEVYKAQLSNNQKPKEKM